MGTFQEGTALGSCQVEGERGRLGRDLDCLPLGQKRWVCCEGRQCAVDLGTFPALLKMKKRPNADGM